MKFPRPFVKLESGCVAAFHMKGKKKGTLNTEGRTVIRYEGESWKTSRLSFHLNCQPIPRTPENNLEGLVLHSCDNDWCINPEHLRLGSQKQNVHDMYDRHPTIRAKLSASSKGRVDSEETRAKKSLAATRSLTGKKGPDARRFGKRHTEETKRKISASKKKNPTRYWLGKPRSEETRKKISESLKRRSAQ